MVGAGLVLQPDEAYLDRVAPLFERGCDYFEVAPETLWRERHGRLTPNGFFRRFLALGRALRRPFVAHGVGFSVGSASAGDARRTRRWLARIALDHAAFRFRWYTDHLGVSAPGGLAIGLPLALPMTAGAARVVRERLAMLRAIVPEVGVENTAAYFVLGDAMREPAFLRAATRGGGRLLLDLHNVHTMAENLGFDAEAYVAALPLERVVEIHVAGGSPSDPSWLASRRVFRLDGHDAAVPERVWSLLDFALPRCPKLRGVTLERMEGTISAADVALFADEWKRVRRAIARRA